MCSTGSRAFTPGRIWRCLARWASRLDACWCSRAKIRPWAPGAALTELAWPALGFGEVFGFGFQIKFRLRLACDGVLRGPETEEVVAAGHATVTVRAEGAEQTFPERQLVIS